LVLATAGCERRPVGETSTPAGGQAVARVNGETLRKGDFAAMLPDDYQRSLTLSEQRNYLDRWIAVELLYDEAKRSDLHRNPDILAKLERYKKDLVSDMLVQQILKDRAVVADDEVRAYYDQHIDEYTKEYRVSHILVSSLDDIAEVKKQLERRSFSWVERRHSIDRHTGVGGDLGFLSKGNMIPEFEQVVFDMEVGEVSDVIESEFGYHLIKLTDVRDARGKLDYDEVAGDIYRTLLLEKRTAVYDSLIASLRERADIEILDPRLALVADAPSDAEYDQELGDTLTVADPEE
jgi:peptidyl-prolyl cis-trans isomerase C